MKRFFNFLVKIWASPHPAIGIRPHTGRLMAGLMGSLCYVARCSLGPRLSGRGLPPFGRHHFAALMRVPARFSGLSNSCIFIFLFLGIMSCHLDSDPADRTAYYFPTDELEDGLVYIYKVSSPDSLYEDVWFYKSIIEDTAAYFTAQQYDPAFNVTRFQLYRLTEWGAELDIDISYTTDSMGLAIPLESEVVEKQAFKFSSVDTETTFQMAVSYPDIENMGAAHKKYERQYIRDTTFIYNNKELPAILIDVKETVIYDKSGRSDVTHNIEMYAQGYGLVYMVKNNPDEMRLSHRLDTIYQMQDFLKVRFSE